jgi:hypothetical protein
LGAKRASALNAFVIIRLDRRDLVWINVTANPTAEWIAHQISEAFPWDEAPRYLIRDWARIFGAIITRRLRSMGIRDKPVAPAFVERLIGSIRRECLDHVIVCSEPHLRRIMRSYANYYNMRTHRSLNKDAPTSRPIQRIGIISSRPILGGLHRHYVRFRFPVHTPRVFVCEGAGDASRCDRYGLWGTEAVLRLWRIAIFRTGFPSGLD